MTPRLRHLLPVALASFTLALAACGSTAAGSASPGDTGSPGSPPSSAGPVASTPVGGGSGSEPGAPGDGDGIIGPGPGDPGQGVPGPGRPQLVVPKPGQRNVRAVAIAELAAEVDGQRVVLNARWWSGVEPCAVLDSVVVERDGATFTVTLNEGSGAADVACIDIAVWKATVIDLGDLASGTYAIRAALGDAAPITVVVT